MLQVHTHAQDQSLSCRHTHIARLAGTARTGHWRRFKYAATLHAGCLCTPPESDLAPVLCYDYGPMAKSASPRTISARWAIADRSNPLWHKHLPTDGARLRGVLLWVSLNPVLSLKYLATGLVVRGLARPTRCCPHRKGVSRFPLPASATLLCHLHLLYPGRTDSHHDRDA